MADFSVANDLVMTPTAFRALSDWTYEFACRLRQAAVELAGRERPPAVITLAVLEQALPLACANMVTSFTPPLPDREGDQGSLSKAS